LSVSAWVPWAQRADLRISDLVLTQIAWPQRVYALGLYEKRFGELHGEAERRWIVPCWQFELLVQQDHITSLAGAAEWVVLCPIGESASSTSVDTRASRPRPPAPRQYRPPLS
jgi:hypothetical protein